MTGDDRRVVRELVDAYGRTYAEDAGIKPKDTPQPLYRLLVPAHLLSARIRGEIAVGTARALYDERTAPLPRSPSGTGGTPIRSGSASAPHPLRSARRRGRTVDGALARRPATAARGGGR